MRVFLPTALLLFGCAGSPDTGNSRVGSAGFQIAETVEAVCPAVLTKTPNRTDACNVAGTNPQPCTGTQGGAMSCPVRAGNKITKACDSGPTWQGIVTSQDQASFGWEQDTVSMCCHATAPYSLAVKTCAAATGINVCNPGDKVCGCPAGGPPCPCPAGHYCSSCGDGGTDSKCVACFTIPGLAACGLTDGDETCSANADTLVCRHACPYFPGLSPPTLTLIGANPLTVECAGDYVDPGATAHDDCGTDLGAAITTTSTVDAGAVGSYTVSYAVSDSSGVASTASRTVLVEDTTGPTVSLGAPIVLWPPNHALHSFTLADCATATDACAGPLDVNAAGVITGASPGVIVTGPHSFALRAERPGNGDGRVAEVHFRVSDPSGNATAATCVVVVPHDRGHPLDL
jgi:hypothetical protein